MKGAGRGMRPAPFPQRHIHAPGVHKVERDGEREGQAVVEKIMLEGGGTLLPAGGRPQGAHRGAPPERRPGAL